MSQSPQATAPSPRNWRNGGGINKLSSVLLLDIFAHIRSVHGLATCSLVCRRWHALTWAYALEMDLSSFQNGTNQVLPVNDTKLVYLSALSPAIRHLNLRYCTSITDAGIETLTSMVNLRTLLLQGCRLLTDSALKSITKMKHLQRLDLTGLNGFSPAGLRFLGTIKNLEILSLPGIDSVDDRVLSSVGALAHLRKLDISKCVGVTEEGVRSIGKLVSLTHLNLSGNSRLGQQRAWTHLTNLVNLKQLKVKSTVFSEDQMDDFCKVLPGWKNLEELRLGFCQIRDSHCPSFASLTSLHTLSIHNASALKADSYIYFSRVVELDLSRSTVPVHALECLPQLVRLELKNSEVSSAFEARIITAPSPSNSKKSKSTAFGSMSPRQATSSTSSGLAVSPPMFDSLSSPISPGNSLMRLASTSKTEGRTSRVTSTGSPPAMPSNFSLSSLVHSSRSTPTSPTSPPSPFYASLRFSASPVGTFPQMLANDRNEDIFSSDGDASFNSPLSSPTITAKSPRQRRYKRSKESSSALSDPEFSSPSSPESSPPSHRKRSGRISSSPPNSNGGQSSPIVTTPPSEVGPLPNSPGSHQTSLFTSLFTSLKPAAAVASSSSSSSSPSPMPALQPSTSSSAQNSTPVRSQPRAIKTTNPSVTDRGSPQQDNPAITPLTTETVEVRSLSSLRNLPSLRQLSLRVNNLTNADLSHISKCKKLRELDLLWLSNVTTTGLQKLARLRLLQQLNLTNCKSLNDETLQIILPNMKFLKALSLAHCTLVGDAGLLAIASNSLQLRYLVLFHLNLLTNEGITSLVTLSELEVLEISGCNLVDVPYCQSLLKEFLPGLHVNHSSHTRETTTKSSHCTIS